MSNEGNPLCPRKQAVMSTGGKLLCPTGCERVSRQPSMSYRFRTFSTKKCVPSESRQPLEIKGSGGFQNRLMFQPHPESTSFTSMGSLVRVQYRPHKNQNHLNGGSDFLLCPAPDIKPVDPRCETSTGQTKEASPQWGVPQASALSLLARNERRARSKGEQRRLSERNTGSSPVQTT